MRTGKGRRSYDTNTSFIDLLFNVMMGLLVLFLMTLPYISPTKKDSDGAHLKAEYIITMEWDVNADVDLWVQDPTGQVVWFRNKETNLMHLDYDNMGSYNNTVTLSDGTIVTSHGYSEAVTIRGIIPGEYTINAHLYSQGTVASGALLREEVPVKVTVQKLNPSAVKVFENTYKFQRCWEEHTFMRMSLDADGSYHDITQEKKNFVSKSIADQRQREDAERQMRMNGSNP